MSKAAITRGILAFMTATCVPTTASSQSVRDYERRVDTLLAWSQRASAAFQTRREQVQRPPRGLDTVRVDFLQLVVSPDVAQLTTSAARTVIDELRPFGVYAPRLLASRRFVVRRADPEDSNGDLMVTAINDKGLESVGITEPRTTENVVAALLNLAHGILHAGLGDEYGRWYLPWLYRDTVSDLAWSMLRLNLVSSPTTVAHRCYDGDASACAVALGLRKVESPARELFDPPARRRVVVRDFTKARLANRGLADRCMAGADSACVAVLEMFGPALPQPLSSRQRRTLVQLALRQGGEGAIARLFAALGTPGEKLSAAAGIPLDSLLRLWQLRVRHTRAATENMTVMLAAASLGWIALFGALSLRSSRWR